MPDTPERQYPYRDTVPGEWAKCPVCGVAVHNSGEGWKRHIAAALTHAHIDALTAAVRATATGSRRRQAGTPSSRQAVLAILNGEPE